MATSTFDRVQVFIEFLEVAIHAILRERKCYPESVFAPRRAFGAVAPRAQHKEVSDYIRKSLDDLAPLLRADAVEKVVVRVGAVGTGADCSRFSGHKRSVAPWAMLCHSSDGSHSVTGSRWPLTSDSARASA